MIKKIIYWIVFIVIVISLIIYLATPRGTFEELVLQEYEGQDILKNFNKISMHKYNGIESKVREDDDTNKIRKLLNEFSKLNLIEYRGGQLNRADTGNVKYMMFFSNDTSNKIIMIVVYDNDFISAGPNSKLYKISNKDILLDSLDDIFHSLSNVVDR
ncbi:hypothetical protein [Brassicibacter mesophilus]|uniref:hypothetical protein n=1 Tax=Brassicibacter mesophilus TaxID=745119 RepID=UPI003D192592